jgi:TolB-like protein/DNA-binding winged helix-turn-helix (wHTH) protein
MHNAVPMRAQLGEFELDLKAGELLKDGRRVLLQEQPFQILLMLAERSGEVVSRAEIKEKLWPNGTVVEFEHSISAAIKKLRRVLDDTVDNPKYVETVGRRGYRLVVPLRYPPPNPGDQTSPQLDKPAKPFYGHADYNFADSIAVLPFENPYPEMEYLSDGIAETITNRLSEIASLRVVPHSMACRFKGRVIEPARLRQELDVRLLLTGHMAQRGESLVVGAELIDAAREAQLWGKTFNRKIDDIFFIQDEIGQEISNHLHFRLTDAEKSNLSKRGTDNREAYLLRTKAMYWAHKWTPEALQKSFRCIQQAIDADPTYAEAYADLGYMFAVFGMLEYAPPSEMFPRAQAAARKALEIDDSVADAHAVLAFTQMVFDWDFTSAENEARRAIELAPRLCGGYYVYSQWCLTQCRFEEAIAAARRTVELDPLTLFKSFHLGATYLYARRYGDAIEHLKQTLDIDPSFWMIHIILSLAQARIGNHEEAMVAAGRCADDTARKTVVGMVEAISGKRDDARAISRELMGEQSVSPRMRYRLAGIHAELGDLDAAFEWLGKALDGRTGQIVFLAADPSFDNLRDDPRWLDLVRRVGLVSP